MPRIASTEAAREFKNFLNPLGYLETHYTRMMSSLSSLAYRMNVLTPAYLRRMHGLELRYSSLACERDLISAAPARTDVVDYSDGVFQVDPCLCTVLQRLCCARSAVSADVLMSAHDASGPRSAGAPTLGSPISCLPARI